MHKKISRSLVSLDNGDIYSQVPNVAAAISTSGQYVLFNTSEAIAGSNVGGVFRRDVFNGFTLPIEVSL